MASPASAQEISGPAASDVASRVDSTPAGLSARIVDTEGGVELHVRHGATVEVLGYGGEPFLRVDERGVFENRRSPTTYLTRTAFGRAVPPASADPNAAPDWHRRAGGTTVLWHDRRVRWQGAVPRGPNGEVLGRWVIPVVVDGRSTSVGGDVRRLGGTSPWPWLAAATCLAGGALLAGMTRRPRTLIAIGVIAAVVADVVCETGIAWTRAPDAAGRLGSLLTADYFAVAAWTIGIVSAVAIARRRTWGYAGAAVSGLFVAAIGGLGDAGWLSHSALPTALDATVARWSVVGALGLGLGIAGGSVAALRKAVGLRVRLTAPTDRWAAAGPVGELIAGLDDRALLAAVEHIGIDSVLGLTFDDLARRVRGLPAGEPARPGEAVTWYVEAEELHPWTVRLGPHATADRGARPDATVWVHLSLGPFLRLMAGTLALDELLVDHRVQVGGDQAVLESLAPALPERPAPAPA